MLHTAFRSFSSGGSAPMPYRLPPTRTINFGHARFTFGTRPTATDRRHWARSYGFALGNGLSVKGTFYIGVIQVLTIITVRPPFLARGFLCHDFMFGAHPEGPDFIRKARFYPYFRFCTLSYFMTFFLDFFRGYLTFQK
jgi:hypothetical protein